MHFIARTVGQWRAIGQRARHLAVPFLFALLAAVARTTAPSAAADGPIVWGTPTVENRFPEAFIVRVPLTSRDATVTRVVARVRRGHDPTVEQVPMTFTPGQEIVATWTWDTSRVTVPPYVPVRLQVQVSLANGKRLNSPVWNLVYDDNRFPWRERQAEHVLVRWYAGDEAFGREILRLAESTAERIAADLDLTLRAPLVMVVYASADDFFAWHSYRTEWVGGQAFPSLGVAAEILPPDSPSTWLGQVVPHEIAHLVLDQALNSPLGLPPAWLVEGLPQPYERTPEDVRAIDARLRTEGPLPLGIMRSPPGQRREEAVRWYDQARSMVEYLFQRHGKAALADYLHRLQRAEPPTRAFREAFGEDEETFYQAWLVHVGVQATATVIPSPTPSATRGLTPTPTPDVTSPGSLSTMELAGLGVVVLLLAVGVGLAARERQRQGEEDDEA